MSRRDKHPVPLLKNPPRLVTGCARFPRWKWMSLWLAVGVSRAFLKSDLRDLWLPLLSLRLHCPHECVRLSDTALLKARVLLSFCLWMSRTETHWCLETVKVSSTCCWYSYLYIHLKSINSYLNCQNYQWWKLNVFFSFCSSSGAVFYV